MQPFAQGLPHAQRNLQRIAAKREELSGQFLRINQSASGTIIAPGASEAEVNGGATNGWYYDSVARRLIIKVFP